MMITRKKYKKLLKHASMSKLKKLKKKWRKLRKLNQRPPRRAKLPKNWPLLPQKKLAKPPKTPIKLLKR